MLARRELLLGLPGMLLDPGRVCIVLRLRDRVLLHIENPNAASRLVVAPASTLKPFSLLALMEAGKLHQDDRFACSRHLSIGGHNLNCVHPPTPLPMNVARALAYSCNGAVAYFAQRFALDELPRTLVRYGFSSSTGLMNSEAAGVIRRNTVGERCQLQAIGEEGVRITPLALALAYARLAVRLDESRFAAIREGLEGAVKFGTAQAAAARNMTVAGKTGSIMLPSGLPAAWFAGFAPSRNPAIAVVVLAQGRSGGADAAPIARLLIERFAAA